MIDVGDDGDIAEILDHRFTGWRSKSARLYPQARGLDSAAARRKCPRGAHFLDNLPGGVNN
jgi:hypothetical protein